jgi:uncharacterized DUF497 family protein
MPWYILGKGAAPWSLTGTRPTPPTSPGTGHGVRPEEALTDPRRLVLRIRSQRGEERWAALGATEAGRILFVVFTRRRGRVRVITARDATPEEKRRYRKRGK